MEMEETVQSPLSSSSSEALAAAEAAAAAAAEAQYQCALVVYYKTAG